MRIRLTGWPLYVGVSLVISLGALLVVHEVSFLSLAEQTIQDVRTAFLLKPEPQDPNVVIIGITEGTLARFPYREPVDRAFLADLLQTVASRNPRAIALDILFDQKTEPEKDQRLKQVIAGMQIPLVISYTDSPHEVSEDQLAFMRDFVPPQDRVQANLPEDAIDGKVRYLAGSKVMADGTLMPGFARGLVAKLGISVPDGLTPIVWHGAPDVDVDPFKIYPAQIVKVMPRDKLDLEGKVVLIGFNVTLRDQHRTPFAVLATDTRGEMPGVNIHAHTVAQFLEGKKPRTPSLPSEIALVFAFAVIGCLLGRLNIGNLRRLPLGIAIFLILWVGGFALSYYADVTIKLLEPTIALILATWATDAITGAEAKKQRAFINSAFSRYLNPQLVKQLSADPGKLQLGGEMRDMTILFCDIRGFTTISEKFDAHGLTRFINRFLTPMTDLIMANRGTIDKYMGDAIMAFWNAPLDDPDHALHGCIAALRMRERLLELNAQWKAEAEAEGQTAIPVNIGIGLNSGICCVGNVGSDQRFDYSVLGDDVNLASRLEGQSKTYGLDIVIGENTAAKVEMIAILELDSIMVKGKTKPVRIFAVVGDRTMAQTESFIDLKTCHNAMLAAYRTQQWREALTQLEHCRDIAPALMMGLYQLYEERIASYVAAPPPLDWDGVYVALSK